MTQHRMNDLPRTGIKSTASIAGHPIHPMIVPFPIAFLAGALVTDVVYLVRMDAGSAFFSFWLLVAGLATGAFAAIFGLIDFATIPAARAHNDGWLHFVGNAIALILALANVLIRWDRPVEAVLPAGIILSASVAAILVFTGWYGGELAFKHRIGVLPDEDERTP